MTNYLTANWLPGCYTQPLSEDFPTDGDKLIRFAKLAWKSRELPNGLELDEWQQWLIRHCLERYPDDYPDPAKAGRLRYRTVVVSLGRQNGKSVLGALLALYGLTMHEVGPEVIGIASNADQANIIYDRVLYVIRGNKSLSRRFSRTTETRGIRTADGSGRYAVKAAKGAALQGIPISLCLFDELHIGKPEMFTAVTLGTAQRADGMVIGITTAGDDNSTLLKDLYEQGRRAAAGDPDLERFGFFVWEAPEGAAVDDPDALMAANPALACGRMSLENAINDVRLLPEHEARRYRLNQFVASTSNWLPMGHWYAAAGNGVPKGMPVLFTIDRTPDWSYATITATAKDGDRYYTEVVASLVRPNINTLLDLCLRLNKHSNLGFAMDSLSLKDLADELERRGLYVLRMSLRDTINAAGMAYGEIVKGTVTHNNDPLLNVQMPRATRKNVGDSWRISRRDSGVEIDGVMATVNGLYAVSIARDNVVQIF